MSQYLKHKKNGSVYPWTPQLAKNRNMVPCEKDGTTVHDDSGRPDPYQNARAEERAAAEIAHNELANQAAAIRQRETATAVGDSLDGLELDALRAFAQSQQIEIDKRWGEDRVRRHIRDILATRPDVAQAA